MKALTAFVQAMRTKDARVKLTSLAVFTRESSHKLSCVLMSCSPDSVSAMVNSVLKKACTFAGHAAAAPTSLEAVRVATLA